MIAKYLRLRARSWSFVSFLLQLWGATSGLQGCTDAEQSTAREPVAPQVALNPVRAVINCLNSAGFELKLDGRPIYLSIRYPKDQLFLLGQDDVGADMRDVFDQVYTDCGIDLETGTSVTGLREAFERSFPGHPVAFAGQVRSGTLHVRTEDKYMFFVTAHGLDAGAMAKVFGLLLRNEGPLAEGYFYAIRMRQKIQGAWRDSRRFGMGTFFYYIAPVDTVDLDLAAVPLRVTYFTDRVELTEMSKVEAADLEVHLKEGFNEVPQVLKALDGTVLMQGQSRRLSFPYDQFVPFNADIDAIPVQRSTRDHSLPIVAIPSGIDLFSMYGSPVEAYSVGSEPYLEITRRSVILDRILGVEGETFPASDDRFPKWAEEDFYRRFPHRRPR